MKGTVTKLYDIDRVEIPEDMLTVSVEDSQVEQGVQALSLRYAREIPAQTAAPGDMVRCQGDGIFPDGRAILLYPGVELPGGEQAAEAVIGAGVGACVQTQLCGKPVTLTVTGILRREPVAVDDALIQGMGIAGVSTVDGYRSYLKAKMLSDQRNQQKKEASRYLLEQAIANSEFTYDTHEMNLYLEKCKAEYDRYVQEDPSMEMDPEDFEESVIYQFQSGLFVKAFCESRKLPIDREAVEEETDQMLEMLALMGEEAPSREEMLESSLENACYTAFFQYVDKLIEERMGA